jgi:glutamyl-Q tRNA(Asp) synthetase
MTLLTFRFAPSPNGELHLGHAYSALLNQKLARATGGRLLLRIEDIDTTRCTPEFEAGIFRDLKWLGLAGKNRCAVSRIISRTIRRCSTG